MAVLAIGVAGAALGGAVGGAVGAAGLGASIGWAIGSYIGQMLFAPSQRVEGPRLSDLSVPAGAEGSPIPKAWGTVRIPCEVIWALPIRETITEEEVGGGKGGPSVTQVTYTYSTSWAVVLHDGPIAGVRRFFMDSKLVYSVADGADPATFVVNTERGQIRIYLGTETQTADPLIAAHVGAANTPAFRGTAYMVFEDWQLADFANHRPGVEAEIVVNGSTTYPRKTEAVVANSIRIIAIDTRRKRQIGCKQSLNAGDYIYTWGGDDNAPVARYRMPINFTCTALAYDPDRDEVIAWAGTFLGGTWYLYDAGTGALKLNGGGPISGVYGPSQTVTEVSGSNTLLKYDPLERCFWLMGVGYNGGEVYLIRYVFQPTSQESFSVGTFTSLGSGAHQSLIDSDQKSWFVENTYLVECDRTPTLYEIAFGSPAPGNNRAAAFMWKARGEIWIPTTNPAADGWYVFNLASRTFSLSASLGIGSWMNAWKFGIEDENGRALFTTNGSGGFQDFAIYSTDGTLVVDGADAIAETGFTIVGIHYEPGVVFHIWGGDPAPFDAFYISSIAKGTIGLDQVVEEICADVGVNPVTTSLAGDTVRGFLIARPMSRRQAIEPLAAAYSFDAVESDGVVKFVKRGAAAAEVLTDDDVGAWEGGSGRDNHDAVTTTRLLETELPAALYVTFTNDDLDFNRGVARARRLITSAENVITVELPVAFNSEEAHQVADRLMRYSWLERERLSFTLPTAYRDLEPTDVLTLPDGRRVRLTQVNYAANGPVKCEAVSDDIGAPVSYAVGNASEAGVGVLLGRGGPTTGIVLDLPVLVDTHTDQGIYIAATGESSSWPGAVMYVSIDGGVTWTGLGALSTAAKIGMVVSGAMLAVDDAGPWDHGSVVTIQLLDPSLTLSTPSSIETFYAGANAIAIGDGEDYEIVQAYTVTDNGGGSFTLKDFLRGRKGTEWAIAAWESGARVVVLEYPQIQRAAMSLTLLNAAISYRAVISGGNIADESTIEETFDAVSCKPYSPSWVGGARQSSGEFIVTWNRRARVENEWRDGGDVALDETDEAYEVDIYDEDFGTLYRTTSVADATTMTYTLAQISSDLGSPTVNLQAIGVKIFQISDRVGRGYAGQAVIGRNIAATAFDADTKTTYITLSRSGLTASRSATAVRSFAAGERYFSEGRYYFEASLDSASASLNADVYFGVTNRTNLELGPALATDKLLRDDSNLLGDGNLFSYVVGDVLMLALDATNGSVYFGKNGVWQNGADPSTNTSPQATFTPGTAWTACVGGTSSNAISFAWTGRFGTGHSYAIPTGFVPMN